VGTIRGAGCRSGACQSPSDARGALSPLRKNQCGARRTDDIDLIARDAREKLKPRRQRSRSWRRRWRGSAAPASRPPRSIGSRRSNASRRDAGRACKAWRRRGGDRPVRLAVTASALNTAVERGDAFAPSCGRQAALQVMRLRSRHWSRSPRPVCPRHGARARLVALTNALAPTSGAPPRGAFPRSPAGNRSGWCASARSTSRRVMISRGSRAHRAAALQADLPGALAELEAAGAGAGGRAGMDRQGGRPACRGRASRRFAADAFCGARQKTPEPDDAASSSIWCVGILASPRCGFADVRRRRGHLAEPPYRDVGDGARGRHHDRAVLFAMLWTRCAPSCGRLTCSGSICARARRAWLYRGVARADCGRHR